MAIFAPDFQLFITSEVGAKGGFKPDNADRRVGVAISVVVCPSICLARLLLASTRPRFDASRETLTEKCANG
jgi:hypothetical protein